MKPSGYGPHVLVLSIRAGHLATLLLFQPVFFSRWALVTFRVPLSIFDPPPGVPTRGKNLRVTAAGQDYTCSELLQIGGLQLASKGLVTSFQGSCQEDGASRELSGSSG